MCGERTRIFGSLVSNPPMWNGPAVYVNVLAEAVGGASAVVAAIAARTSRWRSFIAGGNPKAGGGWTGHRHERIARAEVTLRPPRRCARRLPGCRHPGLRGTGGPS